MGFTLFSKHCIRRPVFVHAFVASATLCSLSNGFAVTAGDFLRRGEGTTLPCRLYVPPAAKVGDPNFNPATKYPLVVFLHGDSERGDPGTPDYNNKQLNNRANGAFVFAEQSQNPAFLLAPQLPVADTNTWLNGDRANLVLQEIDRIRQEYPNVDNDRIYLTGLSLGGEGAWYFLKQAPSPTRYAGAVPICGKTDSNWDPAAFKNTPVWVYHGVNDNTIPIRFSRDLVDRIRAKGGNPVLTELDGVGHNAWTPAYLNTALVNWLFAQRRGSINSVTPNLAITNPPASEQPKNVGGSPSFVLSGSATEAAKPVRIFARHYNLGIDIPANGTTQWTCSIDLVDGENRVSVIAEGNAFGANSHTFFSAAARLNRTVEPQTKWFFDLGTTTRMMSAPTWNDVVNPQAGERVAGAFDSTGARTSLNLSFIRPFLDANSFGVKQDGPFPMNAQADSMYVQDAQVAQLRFTGLTSTSSYSLTLFASRETPGNRITKYTIDGISRLYDPTNNVSVVEIFKPLQPDPTGAIDLTVQTDDGTGFAYLGVVQVDEQRFGKLLFDFNAGSTLSTRPFWNNVNGTSGVVVTNAVNSIGVVTPVKVVIEQPGFQAAWDTGLSSSTVYPASAQRDAFYIRNASTASLRISGLRPGARYNLRFFSSAPAMDQVPRGDRKTRYTVDADSVPFDPLNNNGPVPLSPVASATGELVIKVATDDGSGTASLGVLELSVAP